MKSTTEEDVHSLTSDSTVVPGPDGANNAAYLIMADEALRERQQPFQSLVHSIDGIVWELEYPTWKFTFVSKQAEHILGYPIAKWMEEPDFWPNHVHPDDRSWAVDFCLKSAQKGMAHQFEYRMIAADGRSVWFRDVVTVEMKNGQPVRLSGVMVDITERKNAEEERERLHRELELERGHLEMVLRQMPSGVIIVEAPTGRLLMANAQVAQIWRKKFLNVETWDEYCSLYKAFHTDGREYMVADRPVIRSSIKGEIVKDEEFTILRGDGTRGRVSVSSAPIRDARNKVIAGVIVFSDITERTDKEAFRAAQNRLLEMIAKGAPLTKVLERLVLLIESQSSGMICTILLLNDDGITVKHGAAPSLPESYVKIIDGASIGPQAGSCGRAMYLDERIFVTDILSDPLWNSYRDLAVSYGLKACWSTPIHSTHGKVLGSFAVYYRETRRPTTEEFELAEIGTHIAGIAIERHNAERALRENEERYKALVTASAQHVWRTNDRGEAVFLSSGWHDLTGQSDDEGLGFGWIYAVHPSDRQGCHQAWIQAVRNKSIYEHEFRVKARTGGYRHFRSRGVPILAPDNSLREYIGANTDVTDRKRAEEARRESEERNHAMLRAIPDLMFLVSADGVYLDCHATSPDELLLPPSQLIGKNLGDLLPPDLVERFMECFRIAAISNEPQTFEYDLMVRGRIRRSEARVVSCGHGRSLIIVRNITERTLAEKALRKSEEELRRSHEQIRELAGELMVAQEEERRRISRDLHDDVNQRMAALSISISGIKRELSHSQVSLAARLEELQAQANEITNSLRELSHSLHPAVLEHAGLAAALRSFVHEFSSLEGIEIALTVPDAVDIPPDVALCLYRIAQESLRNIAKHSSSRHAEVILSADRDVVKLLVQDYGCGFNLDIVRNGRGLGLISMEERARLAHGSLKLSAVPGVGTTVVTTVPLRRE